MMTSYDDVHGARGEVFALLLERLQMRPQAIGVIEIEGGRYALKVSLPEAPAVVPPGELQGIPIRYAIAHEPATLLGGDAEVPAWRRQIRDTKRRA